MDDSDLFLLPDVPVPTAVVSPKERFQQFSVSSDSIYLSQGKKIVVNDVKTLVKNSSLIFKHNITALAHDNDTNHLFSAYDYSITELSSDNKKVASYVVPLEKRGEDTRIVEILFHDRKLFARCRSSLQVFMWSHGQLRELGPCSGTVSSIMARGDRLYVGDSRKSIDVWNVESGAKIAKHTFGSSRVITNIAFANERLFFTSTTTEGTVGTVSVFNESERYGGVKSLAVSRTPIDSLIIQDGVVFCSSNDGIKVFQLSENEELVGTSLLVGHTKSATLQLAKGKLFSGDSDGIVIWKMEAATKASMDPEPEELSTEELRVKVLGACREHHHRMNGAGESKLLLNPTPGKLHHGYGERVIMKLSHRLLKSPLIRLFTCYVRGISVSPQAMQTPFWHNVTFADPFVESSKDIMHPTGSKKSKADSDDDSLF